MRLFLQNFADARPRQDHVQPPLPLTHAKSFSFRHQTSRILQARDLVSEQPPVANIGQYFDPWGNNYVVRIDGDYNNQVANPYTANTGASPNLHMGVIAWSLGATGVGPAGSQRR